MSMQQQYILRFLLAVSSEKANPQYGASSSGSHEDLYTDTEFLGTLRCILTFLLVSFTRALLMNPLIANNTKTTKDRLKIVEDIDYLCRAGQGIIFVNIL
ncbi:hypothetical protein ACJX0J_020789 [Zea mays]